MPPPRPLLLDRAHPTPAGWADELAGVAQRARGLDDGDVAGVLAWAGELAAQAPLPASGRTLERWELLATVAAQSLTVARVLEPHLDAVAILAEAGADAPAGRTWGVWAAEAPPLRLEAHPGHEPDDSWVLTGRKPWCSLAGAVSHGLVTAWVGEHERRLFQVATEGPGFSVEDSAWVPAGLGRVETTPVGFDGVPATPVGADGWYLERDGFWWGGIGVAAVWYGGAVGLARTLAAQLSTRTPDQVALMHVGEVDAELAAARAVLVSAAAQVDAWPGGSGALLLAARARQVVATACERVLHRVGHALGPGPLTTDPDHVARVADLGVYLRQHHGERDAAGLGRLLLDAAATTGAVPAW